MQQWKNRKEEEKKNWKKLSAEHSQEINSFVANQVMMLRTAIFMYCIYFINTPTTQCSCGTPVCADECVRVRVCLISAWHTYTKRGRKIIFLVHYTSVDLQYIGFMLKKRKKPNKNLRWCTCKASSSINVANSYVFYL